MKLVNNSFFLVSMVSDPQFFLHFHLKFIGERSLWLSTFYIPLLILFLPRRYAYATIPLILF